MEYIMLDNDEISYENFMSLCVSKDIKAEYSNGEIFYMSPTSPNHNRVLRSIYNQFSEIVDNCDCEIFLSEIAVKFESEKGEIFQFEPDIMVQCDNKFRKDIYVGTPTLIVEILSRATRDRDLILKLGVYERFGVKEYWIVDIHSKEVTVYSDNVDGRFFSKLIYSYGKNIPLNFSEISTVRIFEQIKQ